MLNHITQFILTLLDNAVIYGYLAIFLFAMFETLIGIGMFIPGSVVVLIAGALSAQGYFDMEVLIVITIIAAILGDNLNYFLGKKYGSNFVLKHFGKAGERHLQIGKRFFHRHGAKSVFFGRFLPSVKEIVPFLSGVVNMNMKTFFFWNLLGSVGWSIAWLTTGYVFAQSLHIFYKMLTHAEKVIASVVFIAVIIFIVRLLIIHKNKLMPSIKQVFVRKVKK